ncbi:MAG: DUF1772 domain-containing protein [Ginsengibacter sp.]
MMKIKILQQVSLLLFALVTGVFWGTWFTLTRSIETFTPEAYLAIGKTIIGNIGIPMRMLMPLTLLSVFALLWLWPDKKGLAFIGVVIAFVLLVAATLITVGIEVPIDFQIRDWTLKTMPENWKELRLKWQFYHMVRTLCTVTGLAALISAVVNFKPAEF